MTTTTMDSPSDQPLMDYGERRARRRTGFCCWSLNDRQAAIVAAAYTIASFQCLFLLLSALAQLFCFVYFSQCSSSATFFGYCFLAVATSYQVKHLADVYWGEFFLLFLIAEGNRSLRGNILVTFETTKTLGPKKKSLFMTGQSGALKGLLLPWEASHFSFLLLVGY